MKGLRAFYWVLVIAAVIFPAGVVLFFGIQAAGSVTAKNQIQVVPVMAGVLTVDGLLLGLSPRFGERLSIDQRRLANLIEAFQIALLTMSLMWSLVAMFYAAFSTDVGLVGSWFTAALIPFYFAVSIIASVAILTRMPKAVEMTVPKSGEAHGGRLADDEKSRSEQRPSLHTAPQVKAANPEPSQTLLLSDDDSERKQRIAKLDSALLFLSSTVGLMFAVLRAAISPGTSLVAAGPLVFLGIVMPFYYGYVRGALVRSSTVDRYRGWVFFLVGLAAYGYNLALGWMNQILPSYFGRSYVFFDVLVGLPLIPVGFLVAKRFPKFFFRVLGVPSTPLCFWAGAFSTLSASLFAGVGSNLIFIQNINLYSGASLLILVALGIYLLRESGRFAGYANSDVPYSVVTVEGRWYGKVPRWIGYPFLYGGIAVLLGSAVYYVAFAATLTDVINAFVELAIAFLLMFVGIRLERLAERKDVYKTAR